MQLGQSEVAQHVALLIGVGASGGPVLLDDVDCAIAYTYHHSCMSVGAPVEHHAKAHLRPANGLDGPRMRIAHLLGEVNRPNSLHSIHVVEVALRVLNTLELVTRCSPIST
jgi:hypothetical protein